MEVRAELNDTQGYELFRRAIVGRDEDAWIECVTRYRPLLLNWAKHSSARAMLTEQCGDIADQALARAWMALSPERFSRFPNLAALLGYLRTCVSAAVIDCARAQMAHERMVGKLERHNEISPEDHILTQMSRAQLWQIVERAVETEQERIIVDEGLALDLPPRQIFARHPDRFTNINDVYSAKRNLFSRLQRNPELQRLRRDWYVA